jgi:hypothetical protein
MVIFKLKPTAKSINWLQEQTIDIHAMSVAITLLFSELEPTNTTRIKQLIIQIVFGATCSDYTFTTDKIRICDASSSLVRTARQKKLAFFDHFLHEFRHWMQSRVYKISGTKLDYSDDDVERNTHAYYRNEYEVDARRFARTNLKKFYKFYKHHERNS